MYQMYPQGFMYPFGFTGSNEMSAAQAMSFKLPPGVKKVGDWIRCKDNQDRFYYHNVKTMETVQDCPKEFSEENSKRKRLQTEYKNDDGKSYYFNCVTNKSQQKKPNNFDEYIDDEADSKNSSKPDENLTGPVMSPNMPTNANSMMSNMPMIPMGYPGAMMMMPQFASPPPPDSDKLRNERKLASRSNPSSKKSDVNKEEAIKRFHSLLSDMEIKADSKWVEILPAIIGDERYTSVKTLAERKVIFQDWKKKKLVEEEEEDNVRSKKAESSFFTMLKESKDIDPNMSMRDIEKMFASDKRFKAVDDKRMRSEIMKNFIKTLLKKDKKKRKDERLKYMDEFDTLIRESSFISYNTDQRDIYDELCDKPESKKLSTNDMRLVVDEYLDDLKREHSENIQSAKVSKKKTEKKMRDNFRVLLKESLQNENFHAKSQQEDVLPEIAEDERYISFRDSKQSISPENIFEDFCEELERIIHNDKQILKQMMKENHVSVSQYDSIDNVEKRMRKLKNSKYLAMKVVNTRTIFHEMIGKAKHKASQRAQKRGEYLDDFMALLQEKRVNQLLEQDEVKNELTTHTAYTKLPESDREEVFNQYMEKLQRALKSKYPLLPKGGQPVNHTDKTVLGSDKISNGLKDKAENDEDINMVLSEMEPNQARHKYNDDSKSAITKKRKTLKNDKSRYDDNQNRDQSEENENSRKLKHNRSTSSRTSRSKRRTISRDKSDETISKSIPAPRGKPILDIQQSYSSFPENDSQKRHSRFDSPESQLKRGKSPISSNSNKKQSYNNEHKSQKRSNPKSPNHRSSSSHSTVSSHRKRSKVRHKTSKNKRKKSKNKNRSDKKRKVQKYQNDDNNSFCRSKSPKSLAENSNSVAKNDNRSRSENNYSKRKKLMRSRSNDPINIDKTDGNKIAFNFSRDFASKRNKFKNPLEERWEHDRFESRSSSVGPHSGIAVNKKTKKSATRGKKTKSNGFSTSTSRNRSDDHASRNSSRSVTRSYSRPRKRSDDYSRDRSSEETHQKSHNRSRERAQKYDRYRPSNEVHSDDEDKSSLNRVQVKHRSASSQNPNKGSISRSNSNDNSNQEDRKSSESQGRDESPQINRNEKMKRFSEYSEERSYDLSQNVQNTDIKKDDEDNENQKDYTSDTMRKIVDYQDQSDNSDENDELIEGDKSDENQIDDDSRHQKN